MLSLTPFMWVAVGALLLYFALRVAQMPRRMPFVLAYPLFVVILLGGGVAVFIAASWVTVLVGLDREVGLVSIFVLTGISLFPLSWAARRAIR